MYLFQLNRTFVLRLNYIFVLNHSGMHKLRSISIYCTYHTQIRLSWMLSHRQSFKHLVLLVGQKVQECGFSLKAEAERL